MFSDDCMDTMRQIHFKLLLQEGVDHAITDVITVQSDWMKEINGSSTIFKSFMSSLIGDSFASRKATLDMLLQRCLDIKFRKWKYLLWFIRFSVSWKLDADERNELKVLVKGW